MILSLKPASAILPSTNFEAAPRDSWTPSASCLANLLLSASPGPFPPNIVPAILPTTLSTLAFSKVSANPPFAIFWLASVVRFDSKVKLELNSLIDAALACTEALLIWSKNGFLAIASRVSPTVLTAPVTPSKAFRQHLLLY